MTPFLWASEALVCEGLWTGIIQDKRLSSKGKAQRTLVASVTVSSYTVWLNSESQSEKGDEQETANEQGFWITIYPPLGTAVSSLVITPAS